MIFDYIELQGFKSFPERTKIEFGKGVTAIIGPNGSGKSNISDAVRWVLGEMSLKTMRATKMEDVLFNGSAARGQSNMASVTLSFTDDDGEKLQVQRKYFRNGDSEYYLNGKQVRLKDVYERFYDTGIGREGYSVIGQGKISEVLSQKADERRSIFEEAAGISKYRYKKTETERKLAQTENNLVRVNDILQEVTNRLKPLEKEAENAKKYLVLSEEKKRLEITLWLEKIEKSRASLESFDALQKECEDNLAKAEKALEEAGKALDEIINDGYELSKKLSDAQAEISKYDIALSENDGKEALLLNDIEHLKQIINDCRAEKERLDSELRSNEEAISALEMSVGNSKKEIEKAKAEHDALKERSDKLREESGKALEYEELLNVKYQDMTRVLSECAVKTVKLKTELENAESNEFSFRAQHDDSVERMDKISKELSEMDKKIEESSDNLSGLKSKRDEAEKEYASLQESEGEFDRLIMSYKAMIAADEQRRETLERMERLFEGYAESVKAVLSGAKEGKIEGDPKIHGIVSSIINTDDDYVVAVETALGAAVQHIIVEDEEDAKRCIYYLKQTNKGRATFLPVSTMNGTLADDSRIKDCKGYIGIASELCKYNEKYKGIVRDLLGRTVVADDLDSAVVIAKKSDYRIKIVTLDGQLIHPGGSFTGGARASKAGVFTRAMDIERLNSKISGTNEKLIKKELGKRALQKDMASLKEKLDGLDSVYESALESHRSLSAEKDIASARMNDESQRALAYEKTKAELSEKAAALKLEYERALSDEQNAEKNAKESFSGYIEAKAATEDARRKEKESLELVNNAYLALNEKENAHNRILEQKKTLEEKNLSLAAFFVRNGENAENARARAEEAKKSISDIKEIKEKLYEAKAKVSLEVEEIVRSRESKEKETFKLRSELNEKTAAKEAAIKELSGVENKRENCALEYENVSSALWDAYELTYSTALEYRLDPSQMVKAPSRLNSLRSQIRAMGAINVNAVEEYRETKERYDFLSTQTKDLKETKKSLLQTIEELESTMKGTFLTCFDNINQAFGKTFASLFGGGSAMLSLENPDEPLTCGIDIIIKPPGKSVKSISLLSGGEQSFAAIALYLALQSINPAPFCILDEIDSALDEVNLVKFAEHIRGSSANTQYIVITHRRGTMERADMIYGIIMREKGESDYLKLDIKSIESNSKFSKGIE